MENKLSVAAIIFAVFALGVSVLGGGETIVERVVENRTEEVGAMSSPDVYSYMKVHGYFGYGGNTNSIDPVDDTYTLTASDMVEYSTITYDASTTQAALTVTLPASTTFPIDKEVGATRQWRLENPFTASATTTTYAAGTGIDLQIPETTGADLVININNYGILTCTYGIDSGAPQDVVCLLEETIPGD